MDVGGKVLALRDDDPPGRLQPPPPGQELEEVDRGVVAEDHVLGSGTQQRREGLTEQPGLLQPIEVAPSTASRVAPPLGQQFTHPLWDFCRHRAQGIPVQIDGAVTGPREARANAAQRVTRVEFETVGKRDHDAESFGWRMGCSSRAQIRWTSASWQAIRRSHRRSSMVALRQAIKETMHEG